MDTITRFIGDNSAEVVIVCVVAYSTLVLFALLAAVACVRISHSGTDVEEVLDTDHTATVGYEAAHVSWEEAQTLDVQQWRRLMTPKITEFGPTVDPRCDAEPYQPLSPLH